jgi:hypothetical protein
MRIYVKIKFNSQKEEIESFGNGRYLVYMKMDKDDPATMPHFIRMISKETGAEPKHIIYKGKHGPDEYIFEA